MSVLRSTAVFWTVWSRKDYLSTDPNRGLIGDDEHDWSDNSVFNFEGVVMPSVDLTAEKEPDIFAAIKKLHY